MEVSGQFYAPAALPLGERNPSTHWIGSWVKAVAKIKKNHIPSRESKPGLSFCSPVTVVTELLWHLHTSCKAYDVDIRYIDNLIILHFIQACYNL